MPVLSRYSAGPLHSRFTIETQHPTEPLTPLCFCPRHRRRRSGLDQSVFDALVIALHVIVSNELASVVFHSCGNIMRFRSSNAQCEASMENANASGPRDCADR